MNNFEKCKKTPKKVGKRGGGAITAPCGQDTIPYGSKPLLCKSIVYQTIVREKEEEKTNISTFSATYTYDSFSCEH